MFMAGWMEMEMAMERAVVYTDGCKGGVRY